MKRGGKIALGALGIIIVILALGAIAFGNTLPWWYAIPTIILTPVLAAIGMFGALTAYGDRLYNWLERGFNWLEDE